MRLGVNIDHVATLRQVRKATEPDPIAAAILAELAGANQITVHLREDRRHIQDRDLRVLREVIKTRLNLEMSAVQEIINIAMGVGPNIVTLVPERREELTTEGGLDLEKDSEKIKSAIATFKSAQIPVSLFIDPDVNQVKNASRLGASAIEIHTGKYAEVYAKGDTAQLYTEYERIKDAAKMAAKLELGVHAGHGLTYQNVLPIAAIQDIEELNIGHSIIAKAVLVGMERAVKEMLELINR